MSSSKGLDTKSSAATLVEPPHRPGMASRSQSSTPPLPTPSSGSHVAAQQSSSSASPYSASFDPNRSTPNDPPVELTTPAAIAAHPIHPDSAAFGWDYHNPSPYPPVPTRAPHRANPYPTDDVTRTHSRTSSTSSSIAQEQWNNIMSASLSALANQFSAASAALHTTSAASFPGALPQAADSVPGETNDNAAVARYHTNVAANAQMMLFIQRLENLEHSQRRIESELQGLKISKTTNGHAHLNVIDEEKRDIKEKYRAVDRDEKSDSMGRVDNLQSRVEGLESRMESLEARVEGVVDSIKLDQARLYPRLHNACVALNKHPIKALPMANGKPPINFPVTKGEFEHLTKERYEAILKGYNQPVKGDTNAKREALREFIGLTPPGK